MGRRRPHRSAGLIGAVGLAAMLSVAPACSGSGEGATSAAAPGVTVTEPGCQLAEPEVLEVEVVRTMGHSTEDYTQGLAVRGDEIIEGTGRVGESKLKVLDLATGEERSSVDLPTEVFGEGVTLTDDGIIQLTWKDGVAYRWNPEATEIVGEFRYDGEGWGLTTLDDGRLVMSDGSDNLTFRDPATFEELDRFTVQRDGGPTDLLNELDFDGESLWANRYQTDELLRIDPTCLMVTGVADLAPLVDDATATAEDAGTPIDVVNGVAHIPDTDRYLLTGKWWPTTYEVRISSVND